MKSKKPTLNAALTLSAFEKLEAGILSCTAGGCSVEVEVEIGIGEERAPGKVNVYLYQPTAKQVARPTKNH